MHQHTRKIKQYHVTLQYQKDFRMFSYWFFNMKLKCGHYFGHPQHVWTKLDIIYYKHITHSTRERERKYQI